MCAISFIHAPEHKAEHNGLVDKMVMSVLGRSPQGFWSLSVVGGILDELGHLNDRNETHKKQIKHYKCYTYFLISFTNSNNNSLNTFKHILLITSYELIFNSSSSDDEEEVMSELAEFTQLAWAE